jgi:hypothetical protein
MPSHSERSRRPSGLDIDEDLEFQHRMWRFERVGWFGIAAVLLAAVVGLFGHGPLSRATVDVPDPAGPDRGFMLHYDRFGRAHSESHFVFSRTAGAPGSVTFSLWLSGDYLNHVEVLRITPDPVSQELVSDGVRYHFRSHDGPQRLIFRFKPERGGLLSGAFRLNDGQPAHFRQWLAP